MWEINLYKDYNINDLIKHGFKKYGMVYKLNIPLYKYKNIPVISVNLTVSTSDNYIGYDVIDNNSGELYTHLYNRMYANSKHNKVLKEVIKKLNKSFEKLKDAKIISDYQKVE